MVVKHTHNLFFFSLPQDKILCTQVIICPKKKLLPEKKLADPLGPATCKTMSACLLLSKLDPVVLDS